MPSRGSGFPKTKRGSGDLHFRQLERSDKQPFISKEGTASIEGGCQVFSVRWGRGSDLALILS